MARDKISTKFLIHLVGERPALWDKTSETYKDRSLKETSWREICSFVNENYERLQPVAKQEFTKMITKKWTHIRDSWVKSMKYGYDEKTKLPPKPYVYHDELRFLQKILRCRRRRFDFVVPSFGRLPEGKQEFTQDEYDAQESSEATDITMNVEDKHDLSQEHVIQANEDSNNWPGGDEIQPSAADLRRDSYRAMHENDKKSHLQQKKMKLKRPQSLALTNSHFYDSAPCGNEKVDENRHWNFFKGILPSLNTLDDDHTLQFQAGAITLLQTLKTSQKELTNPPTKFRKIHTSIDGCPDYEWPMHKIDLPKRYSTRATKATADPIADEGEEEELDNGNVDANY